MSADRESHQELGPRRHGKTPASEQIAVEGWNAANPVGTLVHYWRGLRQGEPSGTGRTRTEAQMLGGHTAVVWIEGCSGCVSLTHVEVPRG